MDSNSMFAKGVTIFIHLPIDVKDTFVQPVPWGKVKSGAAF